MKIDDQILEILIHKTDSNEILWANSNLNYFCLGTAIDSVHATFNYLKLKFCFRSYYNIEGTKLIKTNVLSYEYSHLELDNGSVNSIFKKGKHLLPDFIPDLEESIIKSIERNNKFLSYDFGTRISSKNKNYKNALNSILNNLK